MTGRTPLLGLAVIAAAIGVVPLAHEGVEPATAHAAACTVSFDPSTISAGGPAAVTLGYSLSEDVGAIASVTAQEGSGLKVKFVDHGSSTLGLDASGGKDGKWTLTFQGRGSPAPCVGTLRVLG